MIVCQQQPRRYHKAGAKACCAHWAAADVYASNETGYRQGELKKIDLEEVGLAFHGAMQGGQNILKPGGWLNSTAQATMSGCKFVKRLDEKCRAAQTFASRSCMNSEAPASRRAIAIAIGSPGKRS